MAGADHTVTAAKTALEAHYDERIDPGRYHGAVDALVRQGYLEREADGLQDRLALTPAGEAALEAHADWLTDRVTAAGLDEEPQDGEPPTDV